MIGHEPLLEIQVIQASGKDIELASGIMQESAQWLISQGMPMWEPHELSPERVKLFVTEETLHLAYLNGVAVGTVVFQWEDERFWPDVPTGESAYVHRLAVRRNLKGNRISHALIAWAEAKAKQASRKYLRLDCSWDAPRLRAYYESMGFILHDKRQVGPFCVARYQMQLTTDKEICA